MKVSAGVIYNLGEAIAELVNREMPVKIAAKFIRLIDAAQKEVELIEKQRIQIVQRELPEEEVSKQLAELSEMEVNLNFEGFDEDDFENSGLSLTIGQLSTLQKFVKPLGIEVMPA